MARVYVSSVINGRSDRVWARVRDFNGLPNWHPAIGEKPHRGRRARRQDRLRARFPAAQWRPGFAKKLLGLSDYEMFCTYSILESPMGVENYVATLRLTPVTDGELTFVEWTAEFDCAPDREAELVANIGTGIFQGGFDALKRAFGG